MWDVSIFKMDVETRGKLGKFDLNQRLFNEKNREGLFPLSDSICEIHIYCSLCSFTWS